MIKSVCWMKMSYCLPCDGFRKYPGGSRWYSFFPHLSLLLVLLPVSFYPILHHPTPKSPFLHLPSLHAIFDHPILESPFPHLPISHVILEHPILVPSFPHFPSLHALHHHPILDHHILVPPSPHLPTPHAIFDHPILVPSFPRPSSLHAIIPADSDAGGAVVALSRRGRNFSAFSLTFSFFFVFLCFFSYFFFFSRSCGAIVLSHLPPSPPSVSHPALLPTTVLNFSDTCFYFCRRGLRCTYCPYRSDWGLFLANLYFLSISCSFCI